VRPAPARRAPGLLALLSILVPLAACGLPQPFRHDDFAAARNPLVALRSGIGVTLPPVQGAPPPLDLAIAQDVAQALRDWAEIPATATIHSTPDGAGLWLLGTVSQADVGEDRVAVTILWRLTDASETLLEERTQTLAVPLADWIDATDAASRRVTRDGAPMLARLVQGDVALPPAAPQTVAEGPSPGAAALPPDDPGAPPAVAEAPQPEPAQPARPSAAGSPVIVMAPPEVTQAPGDGKRALTEALTRLLKLNAVLIQDRPNPGRIHVTGAVTVEPATDPTRQRVSLSWRVLTEDGEELGTLTQENVVPAGRLDGAWGDTAYAVAEAALMGIGEILVRKGAAPPPGGG